MGGNKASQQNRKLVRLLTLPARCLTRARDYYVKGMNRCAVNPPKQRIGRSYSSATARRTSNVVVDDSEDFRELLRAASGRKEGNAAVAQPPQMRLRKTPRSCSVAMGRIDEEKPCFFEKEDDDDNNNNIYVINPHQLHYYPRSKTINNQKPPYHCFYFATAAPPTPPKQNSRHHQPTKTAACMSSQGKSTDSPPITINHLNYVFTFNIFCVCN
nr:3-isopropylmalate dehydratase large subunit like [Ipomoea batatas]